MPKPKSQPLAPAEDQPLWEEDRALRAILEGTARATGKEFFRALVKQLAVVLQVRYGIVTELLPDNSTVRSLAYWDSDHFLENLEYPVLNTPCEAVVLGKLCHHPSNLQETFPKDEELGRMGAVSYFGVPLFDNDRKVVGHLAVLDTKPMPAQPRAKTILEIFAARAAAELTSIHTAETLRESEANFRQLTEEIQEVFWLVTADTKEIVYVSPAYDRIWGRSRQILVEDSYAWTNAIHPLDRERVVRSYEEDAATGGFRVEYRIIKPDGTIRWIQDRGFPVRDQNGEVYRVAGIATDITKQKMDITGKLLSAQEDERRRLARELHDDLTQRLALLAIEAGKLEQLLRPGAEPVSEKLKAMKEQIAQLSQDAHGISRRLHPAILEDLGLVEAIRSQCDGFEDREGTPVEFSLENVPEQIEKDVALCFYRIAQESLRNIAKHAVAASVSVSLLGENGNIELSIEDTGVGFDPKKENTGLGLASMAERVRLVHGTFDVHSTPGRGTRIRVTAPLIQEAE